MTDFGSHDATEEPNLNHGLKSAKHKDNGIQNMTQPVKFVTDKQGKNGNYQRRVYKLWECMRRRFVEKIASVSVFGMIPKIKLRYSCSRKPLMPAVKVTPKIHDIGLRSV